MMNNYNAIAQFYDCLTDNVEYEARSTYISGFLSRYGVNAGANVLDIACGTGRLTKLLSDNGYKVSAVDISPEMLSVADERCSGQVSFYLADMTSFCDNIQYDACVCSLDGINHLANQNEVTKCFGSVAKSLRTQGIFIFDVNTIFKHREILAGNAFVFDEEDFFLSWDNELVDHVTVRIFLDLFVYKNGIYERYSDTFCERAYTFDEMKKILENDFEIIGVYDDLTINEPKEDSQRLYYVCRRK